MIRVILVEQPRMTLMWGHDSVSLDMRCEGFDTYGIKFDLGTQAPKWLTLILPNVCAYWSMEPPQHRRKWWRCIVYFWGPDSRGTALSIDEKKSKISISVKSLKNLTLYYWPCDLSSIFLTPPHFFLFAVCGGVAWGVLFSLYFLFVF